MQRDSLSIESDHDRVIEKFADAVAAVPADEPLMEGLVRRAKTSGLQRIVADPVPGNALYDAAVAELVRRQRITDDMGVDPRG